MMLDPFCVDPSRVLADTNRKQKLQYHLVPFARCVRETSASTRQRHGGVGLGFSEAVALQSSDRAVDGDMRDAELSREIGHSALTFFTFDLVDRLDVILGKLRRVSATCPNVLVSGFPGGWHDRSA